MASSPSQLARIIGGAFGEGRIDELVELIHEKAEVASFVAPDRVLSGRDEIIEASRHARHESMYQVTLDTVRDLSTTIAIGTGSARYEKKLHVIATVRSAWLWKFEDGRLVRSVHYASEDEALSSYDPNDDGFELGTTREGELQPG